MDKRKEAELKVVLGKSFKTNVKKDLNKMIKTYVSDVDNVIIDSGINDKHVRLMQIREHFKQDFNYLKLFLLTFKSAFFSTAGNITYFVSDVEIQKKTRG